jgi:hypothetical protein
VLNLYQLYEDNGHKAGFLVRRATWGGTYALVKNIGGIEEGKLRGRPPYWGSRPVIADVFGKWEARDVALPCPGCYQWYTIAHPGERWTPKPGPILARAKITDEQRKKIADLLGLDPAP